MSLPAEKPPEAVPQQNPGEELAVDQSDQLGQLAAALAKAQGMMTNASKDTENPYFGHNYADLAAVWDACREALSTNGLAVIQQVRTVREGVLITTTLAHASGEWLRDRLTMPVEKRTPQGIGSAITYGRRYALAALVGVAAEEDDDGNAAEHFSPEAAKAKAQTKTKPAKRDRAALEQALKAATDRKAVEALLPEIRSLPEEEQVALRQPYSDALARVSPKKETT